VNQLLGLKDKTLNFRTAAGIPSLGVAPLWCSVCFDQFLAGELDSLTGAQQRIDVGRIGDAEVSRKSKRLAGDQCHPGGVEMSRK